jgi:hypothetical protein
LERSVVEELREKAGQQGCDDESFAETAQLAKGQTGPTSFAFSRILFKPAAVKMIIGSPGTGFQRRGGGRKGAKSRARKLSRARLF